MTAKKADGFDWEVSMKRIEEIVRALEGGGAGLDDSIKLFEEGTKLVKGCRSALEKAEVRVSKLIDEGETPRRVDFGKSEDGGE